MRRKRNRWPTRVGLLLVAGALVLSACQGSSDTKNKSNPYVDTRTDAELQAVANQALVDALAADTAFTTVDAVTEANSVATGLVIEGQASDAVEASQTAAAVFPRVAALGAERLPAGSPGQILANRLLAQALAPSTLPGGGTAGRSLTLSYTFNCAGGGTAELTGSISATVVQLSSAFSYNATVDLVGCADSAGDVLYGQVVYAGFLVSDTTDTVYYDFDYNLTINGGVAAGIVDSTSGTTAHYNFILRDTLDLTGTHVSIVDDTGDWTLNLSLRLDDGLLNVVCTVSGTAAAGIVTAADYTCTATASVL